LPHYGSTPDADWQGVRYPERATQTTGEVDAVRVEIRTQRREQMVDITSEVRQAVRESGVTSGYAIVYCPHTTAGITVNEAADPDVAADILAGLARLVPPEGPWRHAEGNSDAHLKSTLVGVSTLVPVMASSLALGTWQGVFLCEFDGPRTRAVVVSVHAE
jgi:secondary thiamine-phosphate synthase enzyme